MKNFGQKTKSAVILISTLFICLLIFYLSTEVKSYQESEKKKKFKAILSEISDHISTESQLALNQLKMLSNELEKAYLNSERCPELSSTSFQFTETGMLYNDHTSAVSSIWAPAKAEKSFVLKSLAISKLAEPTMKELVSKGSIFSQAYFNDNYFSARIVPPIDVQAQLKDDLQIPEMNFFYLADPKHNPSCKAIWISEPYVDPAGRGRVISAIAPVYLKDQFMGVCGADISIFSIINRWFQNFKDLNIIILSQSGQIVFGNSDAYSLLSLPDPVEYQYTGSIRSFTFMPDTYNLLKSPTNEVRKAAVQILKEEKKETSFCIKNKVTTLLAEKLKKIDWTIVIVLS